jgi:hypothetical protein
MERAQHAPLILFFLENVIPERLFYACKASLRQKMYENP